MLIFYPLAGYMQNFGLLAYHTHAKSCAQEQELCSAYYANYIQVCMHDMNKSQHTTDNFRKTVMMECIYV